MENTCLPAGIWITAPLANRPLSDSFSMSSQDLSTKYEESFED